MGARRYTRTPREAHGPNAGARVVLAALVLAALAPIARSEHRDDGEVLRVLHTFEARVERANHALTEWIRLHEDRWGPSSHERKDTIKALFGVNRLTGSLVAFRALLRDPALQLSRAEAFQILRTDTEAAGELVEHAVQSCRAAHPRQFRAARERMLSSFARVERSAEEIAYTASFVERSDRARRLAITELSCPHRKKYTYRMDACVEGRDLANARVNVQFVKRMSLHLDPWQREVSPAEIRSSDVLADGHERRCYHLRQIGKEIRTHQRDNVYLIVERPDGGDRVVRSCWPEYAIELER